MAQFSKYFVPSSAVAALLISVICLPQLAFAFEDTKVMPVGVRRLSLRLISTGISEKTNGAGEKLQLEKPLEKNLTFKDILKSEKDLVKRQLTSGYLEYEGFGKEQAAGQFLGDVKSRVLVYAPVFGYGLTENVTLGLAVPIYDMAVSVGLGFQGNETGQRFLNTLTQPINNQRASAIDAGQKLNDAVQRLNNKLEDNGFKRLSNWRAVGLGDTTALAKVRWYSSPSFGFATTSGFVAPTGRRDDPNNLIDKGFGDGQWDVFAQGVMDQPLAGTGVTLSQHVKYTHQLPSRKTVRLSTDEETIEVGSENAAFKLGDKVDAGISGQFETDLGITGGMGYLYYTKFKDLFRVSDADAKKKLEVDSFEQSHTAEFEIGYSAVPAFRRKEIAVPFETKLSYKRQLISKNMPVSHLVQIDCGVFF